MKIVSWNINGLRASIRNSSKDLKGFLDSLNADIICLQETKTTRDQLDESMYSADGYNGYFSFCKTRSGYSGVVTFCREAVMPVLAEEGLTGVLSTDRQDSVQCYGSINDYTEEELASLDAEGRSVITEHMKSDGGRLVVVNVYCPMVERDSENQARMEYKIKFYTVLKERCAALERAGKSVLVVGDLNFTREVKDSAYLQEDPSLFGEPHPARECLQKFIVSTPPSSPPQSCTLLDTFRYLNPDEDKAFTCWSTLLDCRKTNYGTRIDYILCSTTLASSLCKAEVWQQVYGSDHCPVFAEFELSLVSSTKQPSLSASNFSLGKQKKMSDFFSSDYRKTRGSTNDDSHPPPAKKAKIAATSKPPVKQTLLSFMKTSSQPEAKSSETAEQSMSESTQATEILSASSEGPPKPQKSAISGAWQSIFKGPPKAPLCDVHKEPCVLRIVKKQGPNLNRQFWVCAKPHGSKNDPASRCDYFKWVKKK